VYHDLRGKIPLILKGKHAQHGIESTVVDCSKKTPILLRPGSITLEALEKVVGKIRTTISKKSPAASPGMRHAHYQPSARVKLIEHPDEIPLRGKKSAYIGIAPCIRKMRSENVRNGRQYAQKLFHFFRECDAKGIRIIYAQKVPHTGVGRALMDRLQRSAGKE
jgi:L-threonylcarbamoyladenylate synthase